MQNRSGGRVISFWHNIGDRGKDPVHYRVCRVRIELCANRLLCTSCVYSEGQRWQNEPAVSQAERTDSFTRTQSAESELWVVWLILELWWGYVMSGICDRSSMRWWWWSLHKPAVPPETHEYCTCSSTHSCLFVHRCNHTHTHIHTFYQRMWNSMRMSAQPGSPESFAVMGIPLWIRLITIMAPCWLKQWATHSQMAQVIRLCSLTSTKLL